MDILATPAAVRDAQTVVQAARDVLELAQTDVMQVVQDAKVVVTTVCIGVQMDAQIHV